MISNTSQSYSKAIFSIARENDFIEDLNKYSRTFLELFEKNPLLTTYLSDYFVESKEKKEFLDKILDEIKSNETFKNFIYVIIDDLKSGYLREIFYSITKIYDDINNIVKGKIYSTKKLDKKDIIKFEEIFSKKLSKKISFENEIDEKLISGVKVVVNDQIWENSLKSRLKQLSTTIIKE